MNKNLCETCGKLDGWVRYNSCTRRNECPKCAKENWNELVKRLKKQGVLK